MPQTMEMRWTVHTVNLLKEIGENNPTMAVMKQPINIFGRILHELAECASRINDPELNDIMMRLTLYEVADPESKAYNKKVVDSVRRKAETAKRKRLKK